MGFQAVGREPDDITINTNASELLQIKALGISNSHISAAAAISKSKLAALDIVNADVNAAAAISKSKLAALDIVNADVNAIAAIAKSKLAALDIVNADVNAAAAIADSKLSFSGILSDLKNITAAQGDIIYYNGTNWVKLAAGISGQFLKTQGGAANPLWASAGDMILMYSASGTFTDTADAIIWTKTFAAGDFAAADGILVFWQIYNTGGNSVMGMYPQIYDGINTFTSAAAAVAGDARASCKFIISQMITNTKLMCYAQTVGNSGNQARAQQEALAEATMVANWITTAFTLRGRGNVNANSGEYRVWVYKIKG